MFIWLGDSVLRWVGLYVSVNKAASLLAVHILLFTYISILLSSKSMSSLNITQMVSIVS